MVSASPSLAKKSQQAEVPPAEAKKFEGQLKALFDRMGRYFVEGNVKGLLSLYAEDYSYKDRGKEVIAANLIKYFQENDDISTKISNYDIQIFPPGKERGYWASAALDIDRTYRERPGSKKKLSKKEQAAKMEEEIIKAAEGEDEITAEDVLQMSFPTSQPDPKAFEGASEKHKRFGANFRLEKRGDTWFITEAEFGSRKQTATYTPEELGKKAIWVIPGAMVSIVLLIGVIALAFNLSLTSSKVSAKEIETERKLEEEAAEMLAHDVVAEDADELAEEGWDEELEKMIKEKRYDEAIRYIHEMLKLTSDVGDRVNHAYYSKRQNDIEKGLVNLDD